MVTSSLSETFRRSRLVRAALACAALLVLLAGAYSLGVRVGAAVASDAVVELMLPMCRWSDVPPASAGSLGERSRTWL